jgi:hypothetical protein
MTFGVIRANDGGKSEVLTVELGDKNKGQQMNAHLPSFRQRRLF